MRLLNHIKNLLKTPLFGVFLGIATLLTPIATTPVFADPVTTEETTTETEDESTSTEETSEGENAEEGESSDAEEANNICQDETGAIAWLVCPTSGVLANAIDSTYNLLQDFLIVKPITSDSSSPIYLVWQYMRDLTNILFAIVLLVIVISQVTGLGISNYGIKRMLPRIIVAAVLVNLSFVICSIAVDLSNVIGVNLRGVFTSIQESVMNAGGLSGVEVSWSSLFGAIVTGGAIAGIGIALTGGLGAFFWLLVPILIGGILSVIVALLTVAMRQALIAMLIMVSPIAFVAYLLPNTEKYYKKWLDMLTSMLVFFPMFSLLFGASQLAGWSLIAAGSDNPFWVILGMAVQVIPLFMAIPLMKMSGTVLGAVSSRLNNLASPINRGVGSWANSHRERSKQNHIAFSRTPSAGLRRYLDYRAKLRETDTKNAVTTRASIAEQRANRRILGLRNYRAGINEDQIKTNNYTRRAKIASTEALRAQVAEKDTQHVLNNYGKYHRQRKSDRRLNDRSGAAFLDYNRANFAAMNDNAADISFVTDNYLKFAKEGHDSENYRHYITGGSGALGEQGTVHTMAQVIAQAASVESRQRRDVSILLNKFGHNKMFRSMAVGYLVDDNGLAVDKDGKPIVREIIKNGKVIKEAEQMPGQFLKECPEKLVAYDTREQTTDDNGNTVYLPYYDLRDQAGNFVTRIYKKDSSAMKEIFANFDMPINDPINGLYGILSGIDERAYANYGLEDVGLAKYSTTIGRALLSSNFKEKATFAGPMYATSVGNRYIKDFVHQNLARLDNLNKTAKPGGFNTQDAAEIGQLAILLDPDNWDSLFPTDSLESYRNVNGEPMKATVYERDDEGNLKAVSYARNEDGIITEGPRAGQRATREELMNTVLNKFLLPFAPKATSMMARFTQNTADNQKPGTADPWKRVVTSLEKWNSAEAKSAWNVLSDPFAEQTNNTMRMASEIRDRVNPRRKANAGNNNPSAYNNNNPASSDTILADHSTTPNILFQIDQSFINHELDPASYSMIDDIIDYLSSISHPNADRAIDEFSTLREGYGMEQPSEVIDRARDIINSVFAE